MASLSQLRERTAKARAAANKAVAAGKSKEIQRELAAKACDLEEQLRFAEWVKVHEKAGYTVEGDSFISAIVTGLPEGPTYNEEPGK